MIADGAGENEKAVAWEKKALAQDPGNDFFVGQLKKFEEAVENVKEVRR